ncbi:PAS domain-containing protein [Rhodobacteraceae bacterium D3-12]|nr:PAS domain-containing protein [Rhodobacteraceae bacterium D3-12]
MLTTNDLFGKVIDMTGHFDETRFRAQAQVEAYWEALRHGKGVPMRSDIDPRGIENALENAFILEKIAPGLARLRIAGAHLSDVIGMEVRGMPVSSFVSPLARADFAETLDVVTNGPAIARIEMSAENSIGKPELEARMLLLPLKSDFGDINRVLGCFETRGNIGRAPRRFNILRTELSKITEQPMDATTRRQTAKPGSLLHELPNIGERRELPEGFGEGKSTFEGKTHATGSRGFPSYLKLVKSED